MYQQIRDDITQLQIDLESVLQKIFDTAGGKIDSEKRELVQQDIKKTQQCLEFLKDKYTYFPTCT